MDNRYIECIAKIHTDFPDKFGIPRQSGIVNALKGLVIFEPKYRNEDAFRGLEGFSHIWLIWGFLYSNRKKWAPMVKPPRLGGNTRMGVFATRSPNRPNSLGLSSVRLDKIDFHTEYGPVLHVSGIDMIDQTPIYDIKPYITYADSHPDAIEGFVDQVKNKELIVDFNKEHKNKIPEKYHKALIGVLAQDPRPSYHDDPDRIYGFYFAGYNVRFKVQSDTITVYDITKLR
ncbi:MAG: tRNA (N6-threonylcarbamoyladenosine(37)-N6)-methyltransferase TrmO [Clostridiales bacterium]|nr:tRNA (N6-threonylcarbamoyladenosine(37)-N6)-methyltransferase TrmO [Clostridiales bacterium]